MKKFMFLAVAAITALASQAQESVVKEADRAMKADKEFKEVVTIITPAFTDPTTADKAQTWFIPGAAAYKQYDKMLSLKAFNKLSDDGPAQMGRLLIEGYNYFQKALPLDTVIDPKGKAKTKYSKEMVNTIAGHFVDYSGAGADLYNAKDFDGAYEVWAIFCDIPKHPEVAKKITNMPADTVFGEIAFNQALAAWQGENYQKALDAFLAAKGYGYHKKPLYDYAISVATQLKDNETIIKLSEEALPMYGKEDPMYMGQIVNYYLQNKDLDKAFNVINHAIELEPDNSQYYVIRGVLFENQENNPDKLTQAKEAYAKAMSLNPENAQAVYNYGRVLCEMAYALGDTAPTSQAEYDVYNKEKIQPLFLEAAEKLEAAYQLDPDNTDVLKYLENVYYNLNDEKMLNDVKKRMSY